MRNLKAASPTVHAQNLLHSECNSLDLAHMFVENIHCDLLWPSVPHLVQPAAAKRHWALPIWSAPGPKAFAALQACFAPLAVYDVAHGCESGGSGGSILNHKEARLVVTLLNRLFDKWGAEAVGTVAVITPYKAQARPHSCLPPEPFHYSYQEVATLPSWGEQGVLLLVRTTHNV